MFPRLLARAEFPMAGIGYGACSSLIGSPLNSPCPHFPTALSLLHPIICPLSFEMAALAELTHLGSTSTIYRLRPGIVLKSPSPVWNVFPDKAKDIALKFSVEKQILDRLGDHPRIVKFVHSSCYLFSRRPFSYTDYTSLADI